MCLRHRTQEPSPQNPASWGQTKRTGNTHQLGERWAGLEHGSNAPRCNTARKASHCSKPKYFTPLLPLPSHTFPSVGAAWKVSTAFWTPQFFSWPLKALAKRDKLRELRRFSKGAAAYFPPRISPSGFLTVLTPAQVLLFRREPGSERVRIWKTGLDPFQLILYETCVILPKIRQLKPSNR